MIGGRAAAYNRRMRIVFAGTPEFAATALAALIEAAPAQTILAANMVSAVAVAPFGAYPSYVEGHYGRDDDAYRDFEKLSRKPEALADYLDRNIRAFGSHEEFVAAMVPASLRERGGAHG